MPKTTTTAPPKTKKTNAKSKISHEQIAKRAYEIYLERGATPGDPMQDWLRAEMELAMPAKTPRAKSKVITFAA
jgi:Protein of unknown function (DUF2934)